MGLSSALADLATEHRGWFVILFVLPISLVYDAWYAFRAWVVRKWFSAPKLHEQRVREVQRQLKEAAGRRGRMVTARPGWQSMTYGTRPYKAHAIQIRLDMYDVLEVNEKEMWVRVEPMVNMGQLSAELIPRGLTIPVVPELDDLTVGGLVMGVGIETSSHKYGLFNDTVLEVRVALADGTIMTCSRTENRDMWDALPWSYGTLCFLLSAKIRLIKCEPYIRIEYIPCKTREAGVDTFASLASAPPSTVPDFLESLQYSSAESVVMPAFFASAAEAEADPSKINDISVWHKPWFFKHVQSFLRRGPASASSGKNENKFVEYIPLRAYYHRHSRSIFWELEEIIPFGNHPVARWLLGWALPPKVSFLKITQTQKVREMYENMHVIQDMLVPVTKMSAALDVFEEQFGIYPLWLCPYRAYDYSKDGHGHAHRCLLRKPEAPEGEEYEMYVDLGAYGVPRVVKEKKPFDIVKTSRVVEGWVAANRGHQMLYATSYQTEQEFEGMFDHSHYDAVKKQVDPLLRFPRVYEKTCKAGMERFIESASSRSGNGNDAKKVE